MASHHQQQPATPARSDEERIYDIELRFNNVKREQIWSGPYYATSVANALELCLQDLERNILQHGGSIYLKGATIDERTGQ